MLEINNRRFKNPSYYIDSESGARTALLKMGKEKRLALDTESNSLYVYRERVCVVQASSAKANFVFDPLAEGVRIDELGRLTADPDVEIVLHGADYDIGCLKRDFEFDFRSIFDTMIAAQLLNYPQIGLANLTENLLGIPLEKKYTKSDWGRRPLSDEQIEYLVHDTEYLLPLCDRLKEQLSEKDLQEEFALECRRLEAMPALENRISHQDFWAMKGVKGLEKRDLPYAYELYWWRERRAERTNLPAFKILSNETLLRIALDKPENLDRLAKVKGITALLARRHGHSLIDALRKGARRKLDSIPEAKKKKSRRRVSIEDKEFVNAAVKWRKETAEKKKIHPLAILPGAVMEEIARRRPKSLDELSSIEFLGRKRLSLYGKEILKLSEKHPPHSPFR